MIYPQLACIVLVSVDCFISVSRTSKYAAIFRIQTRLYTFNTSLHSAVIAMNVFSGSLALSLNLRIVQAVPRMTACCKYTT